MAGRTLRTAGLAGLLTVFALALAGQRARAGDEPTPAGWVFDLRVVRVDPPDAEGSELPLTLPDLRGALTATPWPEILAHLKARGATTLLLDQRVTTRDGAKALVETERQVPILMLNQQDVNNAIQRSAVVKTGCKLELVPSQGRLEYSVRVAWATPPAADSSGPSQFTTTWAGEHPALAGDTLVLGYREQVPGVPAGAPKAVEIYALITGQRVAPR